MRLGPAAVFLLAGGGSLARNNSRAPLPPHSIDGVELDILDLDLALLHLSGLIQQLPLLSSQKRPAAGKIKHLRLVVVADFVIQQVGRRRVAAIFLKASLHELISQRLRGGLCARRRVECVLGQFSCVELRGGLLLRVLNANILEQGDFWVREGVILHILVGNRV